MPSIINASPSPRNEIRTWMNVGYNFNSAMSDIIDNSVSASSSKIHILIKKIKNKYKVIILDDGCGMTDSDLIENMKIACKSPAEKREKGDLGRYGTGMKTASFSIANSMTVYSKAEHHKLNAARWNILLHPFEASLTALISLTSPSITLISLNSFFGILLPLRKLSRIITSSPKLNNSSAR